jgi:O-antigen ligase
LSYAEGFYRRLVQQVPALVLLAARRLYSGPNATLRYRVSILVLAVILYTVIIGTKPLQIKVSTAAAVNGDPIRQMIYLGITALLVWASQVHRKPVRLFPFPLVMSLLLVWCLISIGWSAVPDIAVRRLLLTFIIMWSIFRSVDEMGYTRTVILLRVALAVALIANFLAVGLSPVAVHQVNELADLKLVGNWRGFLPHKNWAGPLCSVTIILFLFDTRQLAGRYRIAQLLVLIGSGFFLYKTQSKTSMNLLGACLIVGFLFQRYSPAYRVFVIPVVATLAMAGAVFVNAYHDELLAPFWGSDRTVLTGRVDIWPVLIDYWADHPFGAGFGSFWEVGPDSPINLYTDTWVTKVGNGHNGFLDLLVTIGTPGLILALLATVLLPIGRAVMSTQISRPSRGMLMALLIFCIGQNCTETSLLDRDMLMQVFFMLSIALIYKASHSGMSRVRSPEMTRGLAQRHTAQVEPLSQIRGHEKGART